MRVRRVSAVTPMLVPARIKHSPPLTHPTGRAPITSWITGYLTWVGNLTVTLSINFSGGQLILSAITLWNEDFAPNEYQTILMFWAVMIIALLVNIFLSPYLDFINKLAIYWTSASVLIIFVTLFSTADTLRSGAFVFGEYDSSASGWYVPPLPPTPTHARANTSQASGLGLVRRPPEPRVHTDGVRHGRQHVRGDTEPGALGSAGHRALRSRGRA